MYNVLLVCMAGMSTGIMRNKIEQAAKDNEVDMKVEAVGVNQIQDYLENVDLVLLGPQIKYAEKQIQGDLPSGIPLMVIDSTDFGMMRGDAVYQKLMKLLEEK